MPAQRMGVEEVMNLFSRKTRRIIRRVIKPEIIISLFTNKLEGMSVLEKCGGERVNEIYILCHEPCLLVFLKKKKISSSG